MSALTTMPDVEIRTRGDRAWVIATGHFTAARAARLADLVDELVRRPGLRRVSLDFTCVQFADRTSAAIVRRIGVPRAAAS